MQLKNSPFFFAFIFSAIFCCSPSLSYAETLISNTSKISLDFVETDIRDVVRAVSAAYKIPIIVEQNVKSKVTVHLEDVDVWDALQAICGANSLSFQRENGVFHIRNENSEMKNFFAERNGKIDLSVNGTEIKEFLKEFAKNTGLNIVYSPEIQGNIFANIQGVSPESALSAVLSVAKYKIKKKDSTYIILPLYSLKERENFEIEKRDNLFSIHAEDASLGELARHLALEAGYSILLYEKVEDKISLQLDNLSLEKMMSLLFSGSRFEFSFQDSIVLVGEKGKHFASQKTELFSLQYLSANKAIELLEKTYGNKSGSFFEVKEQNAVLLVGTENELSIKREFLYKLDLPIPQILLECLIVEFRKGRNFELGINSGNQRKTAEGDIGFHSYFSFPGKSVRLFDGYGKIGILPDQFIAELASLEENDLAEVLARPSISTLNGEKASIYVTNTSYYQVNQVSADGFPIVDYRSFNDGISLEITPTVAQSGTITITVIPEIKTSSRSTGDGPRDISTRNLQTTVALRTGETLCLGGLQRKTTSEIRSAVPFLGSIPLLGKLFQYVSEEEESSELAVFITPRVLTKEQKNAP